jgi:hypothetical protein
VEHQLPFLEDSHRIAIALSWLQLARVGRVGICPLRLRDRLPTIPIPLRAPDPDARLDLQQVLHDVYDAAGYEDYIYTGHPQPPLHPDDAAWVRTLAPTC